MLSPHAFGRFTCLITGLVLSFGVALHQGTARAAGPAAAPALAATSAAGAGVTGSALSASTTAEQGIMVPHEATYEMRLASVRGSAGIVGAGGTMRYTFSNSCDGWTVETRTDLTMLQTQGGPVQTSWDFLSWESKDGKTYRFRVRNLRNGQVIETYDGEAHMGDNGTGTAVFHLPDEDDQVFDLPKGTMFPTTHTIELIHSARKGGKFLASPIFDGSAVQGAFQVTAAFGSAKPAMPSLSPLKPADKISTLPAPASASPVAANSADAKTPVPQDVVAQAVDQALLGTPSWPMTLAFFNLDGPGDMPDFEVRINYHENGIADALLQDFGDFALRGTLVKLQALPKSDC